MIHSLMDAGEELFLVTTRPDDPGDPVIGRKPRGRTEEVSFRALVGEPLITEGEGSGPVRNPSEGFEMHTEMELSVGAEIRRNGGMYRVTAGSYNDALDFWRYTVERSNVGKP